MPATAKRETEQITPATHSIAPPTIPHALVAPAVRLEMTYKQICELRTSIAHLKTVLPQQREKLEALKAARRSYNPHYRHPNRPSYVTAQYHQQHEDIKLQIRELEEVIEDGTVTLAELEARLPPSEMIDAASEAAYREIKDLNAQIETDIPEHNRLYKQATDKLFQAFEALAAIRPIIERRKIAYDRAHALIHEWDFGSIIKTHSRSRPTDATERLVSLMVKILARGIPDESDMKSARAAMEALAQESAQQRGI